MSNSSTTASAPNASLAPQDSVAKLLIWILVVVVVACWAAMIWGTYVTYNEAPPLPERFVSASGKTVMTGADVAAGKAAFQKADLMDYGSIYGMGSYFGQDYTAQALVDLATGTRTALAPGDIRQRLRIVGGGAEAAGRCRHARGAEGHRPHRKTAVTVPNAVAAGDDGASEPLRPRPFSPTTS